MEEEISDALIAIIGSVLAFLIIIGIARFVKGAPLTNEDVQEISDSIGD